MQEHVGFKWLSIEIGLWRDCRSGSPKSMHNYSMLRSSASLSYSQMHTSRLSSTSMAFWVSPHFPSATTPLFILSAVACARRWGHLSASLGSYTRSMRSLLFFTILFKSGEDCKCSDFLYRDCESTFQSCGLSWHRRLNRLVCRGPVQRSTSGMFTSADEVCLAKRFWGIAIEDNNFCAWVKDSNVAYLN